MTRCSRPGRRTLALVLRDARGRFMRVLPTLEELAKAAMRPVRRKRITRKCPIGAGVQLALF